MRQPASSIPFFCFILLLLVGCQFSGPQKQSSIQKICINIGDDPQTLDPQKVRNLKDITLMKMLFEGLTRVNKEGIPENALAERIELSEDGKTYTFFLKKSEWSNGDPLQASDFAYAWKKIISPDFLSDTAFQFYVIKNAKEVKEGKLPLDDVKISVLDAKTLQVELESPTPYFLELLSFPAFFPIHQKIDETFPKWAMQPETYVSNGPFLIQEWRQKDHLIIKKNEKFWDAKTVKLDQIELLILNPETELVLFEKKQIDWAGSPLSTLPVDALSSLKNSNLKSKQALGTAFLRVNTQDPLLQHPILRKALALAIDRKQIVDHVFQGNQLPATTLVPPSLGLKISSSFSDADRQGAQQLLEEGLLALNLSRETLPEWSLMYRAGERNHLLAQALQQQWREVLGIHVKLEAIEGKVYWDRISKKDFQMASGNWIADFSDPINFLEVFKFASSGSNNTGWENQKYIELLNRASHTADVNLRRHLLEDCEKILLNEMPVIPIFYSNMLYLVQDDLKDVVLSPLGGIDFKWAFIEKRNE